MRRFLLQRISEGALIFFLSHALLFVLLRGLSDPAQLLLGQRSDKASLEVIRAQLHLDEPLWRQYLYSWMEWLPYREGRWQWPTLGYSYQYGLAVLDLYLERFPATALLAGAAALIALTVGVTLGLYQAYRPKRILHILSFLLLSLPGYVGGILLLWIFGVILGPWTGLPLGGYVWVYSPERGTALFQPEALVLPAIALSLRPAAYFFQLTWAQAQEILQSDYIRAARARGKSMPAILRSDVLRNLLPSIVTVSGQWLAGLLMGSLFIEELYDWPGVGKLLFLAFSTSDFPLLSGVALLSVLLFVLLNMASEVLSYWADPRLRE
jgi:dipeptide transport system permease protein